MKATGIVRRIEECVQWGKLEKTIVFMRVSGGLPYYNTCIYSTNNTGCLYI